MRYAIAVHIGNEKEGFGVAVPDLPGCFSAGDTMDEALDHAREAIVGHIQVLLDQGQPIPARRSIQELQAQPDYQGWVWAFVDINEEDLDDTSERVNIIVPRRVLRTIDEAAKSAGESRSGFVVRAALKASGRFVEPEIDRAAVVVKSARSLNETKRVRAILREASSGRVASGKVGRPTVVVADEKPRDQAPAKRKPASKKPARTRA